MGHLSIQVLGGLRIAKDDEVISSFESEKVRALLTYLVVESDRSHRRETLVGLFWPDCSEQAAHHNLSQALFNLRKVLGDRKTELPYLLISRDSIQFNRESSYSLDLERFNAGYSSWEASRSREHPDVSLLEVIVGLYHGEFLQGFYLKDSTEFEEWTLVQRASAHQRVMAALTALSTEFETRGDFDAARRSCFRQLELDPWREEVHCQLMRLFALDGQRSAALAQYEVCKKVLAEELGVEPSLSTCDLYEQIRSGKINTGSKPVFQPPDAKAQRLPLPSTPFFGREKELSDLNQMIASSHCRCISLVGSGGIGKTRLALKAAEENKNEFIHGAAFIPLVSAESANAVISSIASGIGLVFYGPSDPKTQLLNHLRNKQMLVILDNVEQLLAECSQQGVIELVIEILQQAPGLKLLVTSREALNIGDEWIFEVQGLDFPELEDAEVVDTFSSVALFVQHAKRVRPGFEMDGENETSIARLCRLVEGMPLALELAAAWVRILSVEDIVVEIERNLDFLNAHMRDLPERHRSMRAVFDRSWQMLSSEEKQVLSRLSVFRGGFGRQAAEQVGGASLLVLSSLVARSLVRRTETSRYDLHELIRQFARSKLVEDPSEFRRIQEVHSLYYLGLLEEKDTSLHSHHQKTTQKELVGEMDNIREAWDWAASNQMIVPLFRASTTLKQLFELRNWFKEGEWLFGMAAEAIRSGQQGMQEKVAPEIVRDVMLAHCGCFQFRQGKSGAAYSTLAPCVEHLRTTALQTNTDPLPLIYSMGYLGIVCWELGKFLEAKERLQEGLRLAQEFKQRWYEAHITEFLGIVAHDGGEYLPARKYLNHALEIFREFGDQSFTAHTLSYLGRTMQALGEYGEAEGVLRQSLEFAREIDYRFGTGLALDALGQLQFGKGNYFEAKELFSESANLFQEMGDSHRLSRSRNHQGMTALALNQLEDAQAFFRSALDLAQEGGLIPVSLSALAGLSACQLRQEYNQQTLELVLHIQQHPSANQETNDLSRSLQTELETRLPADIIEAAHHVAVVKDLNELLGKMAL